MGKNKIWHVLGLDLERERVVHDFYVFACTEEEARKKLTQKVKSEDNLTKFIPFGNPPFEELVFVLQHQYTDVVLPRKK